MAHPSSDVDELADDPTLRPPTPTQHRRASAPASRGRGKKAKKEVWPPAPTTIKAAAKSSKPSATKGKGKAVVQRVEALQAEEEEDQLADEEDDQQVHPQQQQRQVQSSASASTSSAAAKLDRFRFSGPKPAPMQEGPRSSTSIPASAAATSSQSEPLAQVVEQKKKRPCPWDDEPGEQTQPASAKRSSLVPAKPSFPQKQQKPHEVEKPFYFIPDVDEDGQPILDSTSSASKPQQLTLSSSTLPSRPPSGLAKNALSSPFRPALQSSRSSNHNPPSSLWGSRQPSQPFSPFHQQEDSLAAKPPSSPSSRSSSSRQPPSSINLPTQICERIRQNDQAAPAPVVTLSSTPEPVARQVASSGTKTPERSRHSQYNEHLHPSSAARNNAPPSPAQQRSSTPASASRSQTHLAAPTPRTQKLLTAAQQHEVDELLEGLREDEDVAGMLGEEWEETMEVGDAGGGRDESVAEDPAGPAAAAETANSPLSLSQLLSLHGDEAPQASPDPFTDVASRKEIPRFRSLSPITAPHEQAVAPPAAAATTASPSSAGQRASTSTSASAAVGPSTRSYSTSSSSSAFPPVRTSDPSTFLPLSLLRTPPKPRPQFRLVPLTVEGVTAHLRELVSSSSASASTTSGEGASTTAYLRREVDRLTREVLSRDATISSLSTSLASTSSALEASLEREKQWREKEKLWVKEREKGEKKVDALREVRRGLLLQVEEERGRREAVEREREEWEREVGELVSDFGDGEGEGEGDAYEKDGEMEECEEEEVDQAVEEEEGEAEDKKEE